jgi:hypothetical protein
MQVVSPPYLMYSFPETGMDPLEPQHVMTMVSPFYLHMSN